MLPTSKTSCQGWIHHLARHAVACFLTRGDLWVSWEEGLKVFDELLLDADWWAFSINQTTFIINQSEHLFKEDHFRSVNAGTWLWLSCSSFFQQFFHCYCPVRWATSTLSQVSQVCHQPEPIWTSFCCRFGRKADANGDFIRRYLPVLKVKTCSAKDFLTWSPPCRTFPPDTSTNLGLPPKPYKSQPSVS